MLRFSIVKNKNNDRQSAPNEHTDIYMTKVAKDIQSTKNWCQFKTTKKRHLRMDK